MMQRAAGLLCALLMCAGALAQNSRRFAVGIGVEGGGKAQLFSKTGSPFKAYGGYGIRGSLQTLPADGQGFRSTVSVGYGADEALYNYAPSLVFVAIRHLVRTEFEAMIPTRGEVLWLTAGIGVDWSVGQNAKLTQYGPGYANSLYPEPALSAADLDLFRARRLLVPTIRVGPALRFPMADEGKAAWIQLFIRQDFLDSYEAPVVVTMPDGGLRPQQILVGQKPTYFGLSASYFF